MTGQEYSVISLDCNRFSLSISSIENTHAGLYACALSGTNLMDNINIQIGSECMERKFLVVMIVLNQVCVSINCLSPLPPSSLSLLLSLPPLSPPLLSLPPSFPPSQLLFQWLSLPLSLPRSVLVGISPSTVAEPGSGVAATSLRYSFGCLYGRVLATSLGLDRLTDAYISQKTKTPSSLC